MNISIAKKPSFVNELFFFIIAGIFATITDFIVYTTLHSYMLYSYAKTFSFLSGSLVAYLLNKFITFKSLKRSISEMIRFVILYLSTLVANVTINSFCIYIITNKATHLISHPLIFAFLFATSVSTILNFLGQKFFVFKKI